jgi:ribokinase
VPVRALVVGSLVQDLSFRIPKRPQPGEVVIAEEYGSFRGGKGYNQAVALARLGAEVTMVGAVGHDEHGEGFIEALRREGVDAERIVRLPAASTGLAVPMITPDGDVAFVQHPGANRELSAEH